MLPLELTIEPYPFFCANVKGHAPASESAEPQQNQRDNVPEKLNSERDAGCCAPPCSAVESENAWFDYYKSLNDQKDYRRDVVTTIDLDDAEDVDGALNAFRNALGSEEGRVMAHFVIYQR